MKKRTPFRDNKPGKMRYLIRAVAPPIFWMGLRGAIKLLPNNSVEQITRYLVPPGNPGAGIFYGRHNIVKAITYRATYVPGGFNQARDFRRADRREKQKAILDAMDLGFIAT